MSFRKVETIKIGKGKNKSEVTVSGFVGLRTNKSLNHID